MIINQLIPLGFICLCLRLYPAIQSPSTQLSVNGADNSIYLLWLVCTCTNVRTQTHTTLGGTLNPSHLSTDSSAQSAHPYIKVAYALLLPAASHKPQSRVLRPGLLHAALHISLQLLYQSALSTLISILSEEQRRDIQRRRKMK